MKLKPKLIFSFIVVVFIPVIIVGLFLTSEMRKMALNDAIRQTSNNVERVNQRMSETLKVPIDISIKLMFDHRLKELANAHYGTTFDVVKAYRDYSEFRDFYQYYREIGNIKLYIDNQTMLNNWQFIPYVEQAEHTAWYQEMIKGRKSIGWYFVEDETKNNEKFLSLVRRIEFPEYHTYGVLVITVNKDYLNAILSQEPFHTMVINEDNEIVAANKREWLGRSLADLQLDESIKLTPNGTFEAVVEGKPSKIMIDELVPEASPNRFRIVSIFSIESIVKEARRISNVGLAAMVISFLIALVLIYGVSLLLSKRLFLLSKQITKVSRGNLETMLSIDGNDEIGHLSRQFNVMVHNIRDLMDEVEHTNQQKNKLLIKQNEIKLKMMASQMNPHFLFNALESIRMKAHVTGAAEIAQIVKMLGKMLRQNLEIDGSAIPLKTELEIVRYYLEIQKFRYEDRLSYSVHFDPHCENVHVPALIIQPLVENAIIHGLENKEEGGQVTVNVMGIDDVLHIQVIDNGIGIDGPKLAKIYQSLEDTEEREDQRIGLRNVHLRLQLTYGSEYGLKMTSQPLQGTVVNVSMPIGGSGYV